MVAGAVLIGGGSILLRLQLPAVRLPFNLLQFQYSLGFLLLGLLVLTGWQTRGATRKMSLFLALATMVALGDPPATGGTSIALNVVFVLSVVLLGAIYFVFARGSPSVRPLLAGLWVTLLVHLFYGIGYLYLAIQRTQNLQFAIGIFALIAVFAGYSSMLRGSWSRSSSGGFGGFNSN